VKSTAQRPLLLMRSKKHTLVIVMLALLAGVAIWWLKPGKGLLHDAPRHLPWAVPDYRPATSTHRVLPDGRILIEITHLPLIGIRPEMLAWWYQKLPVSAVEVSGVQYPFYHLFHPTEHGRIRVVEQASDGAPGMGVGALVEREEWFGPFDSKGAGRIVQFSAAGMTVVPEVAGLRFGEIRHVFETTAEGTQYRVVSIIGVEWPLIGGLVNALIRRTMYSEPMLKEWTRHQIEEVGMLQHFLPALYRSKPQGDLYRLQFPLPVGVNTMSTEARGQRRSFPILSICTTFPFQYQQETT